MTRVYVLLGLLTCTAAPAFGQAPPAPPAPPAPVAVPAVPALPPVVAMPIPPIEVPDLSLQLDLSDLRERSREFAEQARQQSEEMREQVRQNAEEARRQAEWSRELAMQDMHDRVWELKDFNFAQGPGPVVAIRGRAAGDYNAALSDLERRQYDRAISRFDAVIAQKSARADGASYWKAYAQYKLGSTENALATIAELRRSYPQSRYLADARVLEADVRKTSGKPAGSTDDDDQIKLLAISSMQNSNPQGAVQLLDSVLKATNSLQVKKRAIFVLAQNDDPAAHQILLNYAKGNGNPDLQIEAIRYLTARTPRNGSTPAARQTTAAELQDIYNSTQDVDVRRAVLQALVSAGDKAGLLKIASSNGDVEIKRMAIGQLGGSNLITATELMQLYQKEENKELKTSMIGALGEMGAADQLIQIAKTEKDPAVRQQAIRRLGDAKNERATQALVEFYGSEQDLETRKAVISALGNQNNADPLIALARKETNSELKLQLVRRIADMAPRNKAAMDFLMEQIK
jgi:HEAT repeat protein/TolA-binding protein